MSDAPDRLEPHPLHREWDVCRCGHGESHHPEHRACTYVEERDPESISQQNTWSYCRCEGYAFDHRVTWCRARATTTSAPATRGGEPEPVVCELLEAHDGPHKGTLWYARNYGGTDGRPVEGRGRVHTWHDEPRAT